MNITEANALNTLLRWLLQDPDSMDRVPYFTDAREAAVLLTEKANKALGAGLRPDEVAEAFERLEVPDWLDDEPVDFRPIEDVTSPLLNDPDGPQSPDEYRQHNHFAHDARAHDAGHEWKGTRL